ncbi:hypothetical protein OC1_07475 [Vibrio cyclitrophicus ZF207]|nr:hypothetical protein OC1_07475 [Vibrio cyclitrophicus ZF207]PMK07631.1 hypothetical protein BCU10_03405 [Vibrio splendidus]PMK20147.1 hypothetical protein BCU04_21515 [Vibrio cyclitrophicus]PMP53302.1 hypothetical protein BCS84_01365 [Vibrio cyclitrophicus]
MIYFDISKSHRIRNIQYIKGNNIQIRISENLSQVIDGMSAPELICFNILFKFINELEIEDFEYENQIFTFKSKHSEQVEELFELYMSLFKAHRQYLFIQYEDSDGHPQSNFEFEVERKLQIIEKHQNEFKQLDLLQVSNSVIIDAISIRNFGGHSEVINRLRP